MTDAPPSNQVPVVLSAAPAAPVPRIADANGMFRFCLDIVGALALALLLMDFCFVHRVPGRIATRILEACYPGGAREPTPKS